MARGRLIDDAGKSTVSSVPDVDAILLEVGRQQLAALFGNAMFTALTGIRRENLAYLFAFPLGDAMTPHRASRSTLASWPRPF